VFTPKPHWWPLIPGGIMAVIGAGLLFGGVFMQGLTLLGQIWPIFLILLGLYVLFRGMKGNPVKN
jgi:predicted membrane protein